MTPDHGNPHPGDFLPPSWTVVDTMDYLSANPLPVDFLWIHRDKTRDGKTRLAVVKPTYAIRDGYGKWLHDTPYFPCLFELIHDLLFHSGDRLPGIDEITAMLERIKAGRLGQLEFF
jgi:hypothetical protein